MRRVLYSVAMSLDGYLAGPNGEIDWIVMDPDIDFAALTSRFDTILMGRRTYEQSVRRFGAAGMPGMQVHVVSRTLRQSDCQGVIVSGDPGETVSELRAKPGRDIWLFGGGLLFRSLLESCLVDGVQVAVIPVLLGGGVPFLPGCAERARLKLTKHTIYGKTGTVLLEYSVT